jgi:multiple sugar transport system permease protein
MTRFKLIGSNFLFALSGLLMLYPFFRMITASMEPGAKAYHMPPNFFPKPDFTNYVTIFTGATPLARTILNSFIVTIIVTFLQLIFSPLAAFAFARFRFFGRDKFFMLMIGSLMVPIQVTTIPLFILMSKLHLINHLASVILLSLNGAFGIFLMRQFFLSLPLALFEAAEIDGASAFYMYRKIALPLVKPGLATLGILTFVGSWSAFFLPYFFLNNLEASTLPIGFLALFGPYNTFDQGNVLAAASVAIFPVFIIFVVAQRWIVESLSRSGVKG